MLNIKITNETNTSDKIETQSTKQPLTTPLVGNDRIESVLINFRSIRVPTLSREFSFRVDCLFQLALHASNCLIIRIMQIKQLLADKYRRHSSIPNRQPARPLHLLKRC